MASPVKQEQQVPPPLRSIPSAPTRGTCLPPSLTEVPLIDGDGLDALWTLLIGKKHTKNERECFALVRRTLGEAMRLPTPDEAAMGYKLMALTKEGNIPLKFGVLHIFIDSNPTVTPYGKNDTCGVTASLVHPYESHLPCTQAPCAVFKDLAFHVDDLDSDETWIHLGVHCAMDDARCLLNVSKIEDSLWFD